jgi:hypothetical protein
MSIVKAPIIEEKQPKPLIDFEVVRVFDALEAPSSLTIGM